MEHVATVNVELPDLTDHQSLDTYLKQIGLPGGISTHSIIVTTEYAGINTSGGIGTFVANQCARDRRNAALLITSDKLEPGARVVLPQSLLKRSEIRSLPNDDLALRCITKLISLLSTIRSVEYQDYSGIGARISQAKASGLLPDTLTTVVHCHGNLHYLENANERWMHAAEGTAEREKISIELPDLAVFPTKFLREFYRSSGILLHDDRVIIAPYWYDIPVLKTPTYASIRSIVFVGKQSRMKGIDIFFDALNDKACAELKAQGVRRIIFLGPLSPTEEPFDTARISHHFTVESQIGLDHTALAEYIRTNAADSLFVEPYRADNFPLAVYDVVAGGGTLLASNSGGMGEIFSSPQWHQCLFSPTAPSLAAKIIEAIKWTTEQRTNTNEILRVEIAANNDKSFSLGENIREHGGHSNISVTVCVPYYNTDPTHISDLFAALNRQTVAPVEVLIVDDCSQNEYAISLRALADAKLKLPYRIIRHERNLGLAAARNTALAACNTEALLNIDSDDVPLPDWVRNIQNALSRNPSAAAAVPYLSTFDDGDDFNSWSEGTTHTYRPLGDGYILSQTGNFLGHANSGVRVSVVRSLGGWDASTKAKWEDWGFYLNILAHNHRIAIIPRIDCLYRVRTNSMVRTYPDWPGTRRIAYAPSCLPRFETIQLQRLIQSTRGQHKGQDPFPVIRRALADYLLRYPRLRRYIASAYHRIWGFPS